MDHEQFTDAFYKLRSNWNIYVDSEIFSVYEYQENNIGVILESKDIIPDVYNRFISTYSDVLNNFKYIFVNDLSLTLLDDRIKWSPASFIWIESPKLYSKSYPLSMVTSKKCYTPLHRKRIEIADQLLSNNVPVYGRGFNELDKKEHGLCQYMFSVAIENSMYDGYFTEKIMDCFATGTIPVYLGDPSISKIFNPDGIINLVDGLDISLLNSDLYYSKIDAVKENLEIVKQFSSIQDWMKERYLVD